MKNSVQNKMKKTVHNILYPNGKLRIELPLIRREGVDYIPWWYDDPDVLGERDGVCYWWKEDGTRDECITFKDEEAHGVSVFFGYS